MKKLLLTALVAFFACAGEISAQAVIEFDAVTRNLGKFNEDKPVSCVFTFTNKGDKPLVIHQAISSCGCTVPKYTADPIQPGQKGQIAVTYNGKGKFPGKFRKPITIRSNASNSQVRIYIEGDMEPSKKQ